ncbi:MAG: sugar phosphate isomerase/epimerase [Clostridia bacterium]|nr:sugar phosphate isomerase/epimerase [Clostridia bacterium]
MYNKISGFSDEIASDINVQFEAIGKLNMKYFEPRFINGKSISVLNDEEVIALKAKMDECGIKASSIGSPVGKIKLTDDFDAHFEMFKRVVKTAKMLDCNFIRIFSFYHDGGEWTADERALVLERLKMFIEYAKKEDVILLHENEKDIYGDIAPRCLDILKELACDNFKAVFDPANFIQSGQDTKEAYEMLKDFVAYMHIKDAMKEDGKVVPAGYGDGNLKYILDSLFANGFDGFLSLEPHLGSFEGLADLELDDKMLSLEESGEGKFILAYNSLVELL